MGRDGYEIVRAAVAKLIEEGVVDISGDVPLEEVDPRYERVSNCEVCGAPSSGHPVLFWKHNTPVVRCTSCGLLYANPRWKAEHLFGRYTEEYWELYADKLDATPLDRKAVTERQAYYLWRLEPAFQNGRLLDVGCATGDFLLAAKAKGWETYGVETSEISAKIAERDLGRPIHVGTLETAPFEDSFFDTITMFDVIEHLRNPRSYIERIARLLRPGGFVYLTTPNIHSLAYRLLGTEWDVIGPNDHLYYFAPLTLRRLLESCGFTIHFMETTATESITWQQWLRTPALKPLAPALRKLSIPVSRRFLMGDGLSVIARLL